MLKLIIGGEMTSYNSLTSEISAVEVQPYKKIVKFYAWVITKMVIFKAS